jgi:hypothetical protein
VLVGDGIGSIGKFGAGGLNIALRRRGFTYLFSRGKRTFKGKVESFMEKTR